MKDNYSALVDDFNNSGGVPATPLPTENKYSDIVDSYNQDRLAQAQSITMVNKMTDPEQAARAIQLSAALDVPKPVVESNLKEYEQRYDLNQCSTILQKNPSLTDWLIQNPEAAAIAHDDFNNMNTLSQLAKSGSAGFKQGVLENRLSDLQAQELLKGKTQQNTDQINAIKQTLEIPDGVSGGVNDLVKMMGSFVGGISDQAGKIAPEVAAGGAVGSVVPGVGTAAGLSTGTVAGFVKEGYLSGTGQIYAALKDLRDANGNPINPDIVKATSVTGGALLGALNGMTAGVAGKPLGELASKIMPDLAVEMLKRPTIAQAMLGIVKGTAKGAGEGAAIGAASGIISNTAQQFAKIADRGDWETVLNSPAERQKAIDDIVNSTEQMALTMGVLHAPAIGGGFLADMARASEAKQDAEVFDALQKGAVESKVRNRSLDVFQNFMQNQLQDSPSEHVFIPGEIVKELYQKHNIEPGSNDALFGFVPDIKEQLQQAIETNGDVVIPTADYLTHIAGTPLSDALKPNIRMRQDGMTLQEALQFDKEHTEHLQDAMQGIRQVLAAQEPHEKIYQDVLSKLRTAGQTIDVASQNARTVTARYATRGERLEQNPFELYQDENLKIQRKLPEATKYIPVGDLDVYLNALRNGKKLPTDKQIYGPSLVDFIKKNGGIAEYQGELQHIGAKDVRGIVTKKGRHIDDMARAAWEAGYLPEENTRPSIDTLVQALRDELHGNPRYAGPVDTLKERFRQTIDNLDETLHQMGVDVNTASNEEIKNLFQSYNGKGITYSQEAKGSIQFSKDGSKIVTLFKDADMSTFMHEMGHLWLDEMGRDFLREDAPDALREDAKVILKWLGAKSFEELTTEQHEQFARGFEAYLREGKAPSEYLATAFQKFKAWLLSIYKNIKELDVPMNDKIRGVFDRMLATDEEIQAAKNKAKLNPIFKDAESAGMTKAAFELYTKQVNHANNAEQEKLLTKAMEVVRAEYTKDWQEKETALRDDMASTIYTRPDLRAQHYLRTGKDLANPETESDMKMKLSKKELVNIYGSDEVLKLLPNGVYSAKEGMPADVVASMFGYRNGTELVNALMSLEAQRKDIEKRTGQTIGTAAHAEHLLDEAVQQEMQSRHGDILKDGSIADEAMKAVHNDARAKVMAIELRELAKQAGVDGPLSRETIENWVQGQIADMPINRASNPATFLRAERQAGKEAELALLKGNSRKAFEAKQKQLINFTFAKEAAKAAEDFEKGQKLFKRLSKQTSKSISQEFLDQIHGLLQKVGYKTKRNPNELASALEGKSLSSFVAEKFNQGLSLNVPTFLLSEGNLPAWDRSTLDQFRGLHDAIKSIAANGRDIKTIMDGEKAVAFAEIKAELVAQRRPGEKISATAAQAEDLYSRGRKDLIGKIKRWSPEAFIAANTKLEEFVSALDNDNPMGVARRVFFDPLKESQHKRNNMHMAERAEWEKIEKLMPDSEDLNRKVTTPELKNKNGETHEFTLGQILVMAMNTGTESNFDKILRGEGWDRDKLQAVFDRTLKKEHWDFVQAVLDRFDHYWPETERLYRKLNGVAPVKLEARTITTPYGDYRGGYFPVIFDKLRSAEMMVKGGDRIMNPLAEGSLLGADYYSSIDALTPSNRTITRTNAAYPLLYDLDQIPFKLGQTIHDLAFRESIINANKFLRSRTIATEIKERLGTAAYVQMKSAIRDIANSANTDDIALSGLARVLRYVRMNNTMIGIFLRGSTILKHGFTALSNSQAELGAKWLGHGMIKFAANPLKAREFVYERSTEMKFRMDQIDRDVRNSMQTLQGDSNVLETAQRFGHYGVAMSDQATAIPTWIGAYDKALSEGRQDKEAIKIADMTVRNAHGASGITDLAAIQRGGEAWKTLIPFFSFMNHVFNRGLRATGRQFKYGMEHFSEGDFTSARRDFAMVLSRSLWYFVVPGIYAHYISHGSPQQNKESTAGWMAKAVTGEIASTIPVVRDIVNYLFNSIHGGASLTPLDHFATTIGKTAVDAARKMEGKPASDRWLQHALDTTGYVFGLPVGGQPAMTIQYLWDLEHGKEHPQNAGEIMHGVVFGPTKKH